LDISFLPLYPPQNRLIFIFSSNGQAKPSVINVQICCSRVSSAQLTGKGYLCQDVSRHPQQYN